MLAIQIYIPGDEEKIRVLRQGLVRRALLMLALLLRSISPAVRRRYPTLQSLVKDGIPLWIYFCTSGYTYGFTSVLKIFFGNDCLMLKAL